MYKKRIIRVIQDSVTVSMWGYFIRSLFYIDKSLLLKISGVAVICFVIIGTWRIYNYKRFGSLHRRKFPQDTTIEDVAEFFGIKPNIIEQIHNTKMITLEKNILNNRKEEEIMCKEISTVEDNKLIKYDPVYYKSKLQELLSMARQNGLDIKLSEFGVSFKNNIGECAIAKIN
jgi:hypothetical protein